MVLAEINVFPVKSLGGASVPGAVVEPWGLRHDRRWLALDADGGVVTAREEPRMLHVTATARPDGGIVLSTGDGSRLEVEPPTTGEKVPTRLSRVGWLRLADQATSDWLSKRIGRPVRLAWLDDPQRRTVSPNHGGEEGDRLNLADAGPLLLTTTASLSRLNDWIAEEAPAQGGAARAPIVMARFRPTLVVNAIHSPFEEDRWRHVQIGEVEFRFAEHCDRCVLTTIDPASLSKGKEPLRSLARHHRWDQKALFGIRLIPTSTGTVHVGDQVSAR